MDERQQRYHQKINFVIEKIMSFPARPRTALDIDGLLYRVQVAIEAAMDIAAMLVRDRGLNVSDDYHNIEQLVTLKIITSSLGRELKKLNGLRNAIVHKYNAFEQEVVVNNKKKIASDLGKFMIRTEHELKTNSRRNKA